MAQDSQTLTFVLETLIGIRTPTACMYDRSPGAASLSNHTGICASLGLLSEQKFREWDVLFVETFRDWIKFLRKILGMLRFRISKNFSIVCCKHLLEASSIVLDWVLKSRLFLGMGHNGNILAAHIPI